MLLDQCQLDNLCPPNYQLTFDRLPVALQKDFIDGVCPMDDRFECITGLYEMWVDTGLFGFRADDPDIGDLVPNMCISTYSDAVDSGFAKSAGEDMRVFKLYGYFFIDDVTNLFCFFQHQHHPLLLNNQHLTRRIHQLLNALDGHLHHHRR